MNNNETPKRAETFEVSGKTYTRAEAARLIWTHTHNDYRGKYDDGTKTVLYAGPSGTTLCPVEALPDVVMLDLLRGAIKTARRKKVAAAFGPSSSPVTFHLSGEKVPEFWKLRIECGRFFSRSKGAPVDGAALRIYEGAVLVVIHSRTDEEPREFVKRLSRIAHNAVDLQGLFDALDKDETITTDHEEDLVLSLISRGG